MLAARFFVRFFVRMADLFGRLSLRQRFLVAPLLGPLLLGALLAAFIFVSQRQTALLTDVAENQLARFNRYSEAFVSLSARHTALYNLLAQAGGADTAAVQASAGSLLHEIHAAIAGIEAAAGLPSGSPADDAAPQPQYAQLLALTEQYRRTLTHAVEVQAARFSPGSAHVALANERFVAMSQAFSALLDSQRQALSGEIAAEVRRSQTTNVLVALAGGVGAGLLIVLSLRLSRRLARALEAQIGALAALADGTAAAGEGDEVQRIGRAVERFQRTQAELRASEQRLRAFFEDNDAVMLQVEPASGAIRAANAAAARFYGYSRAQLAGMTMAQIDILPAQEMAAERLSALHERGHCRVLPQRLADGDERIVEVRATPVDTAGRPTIFFIIHDITERRRAEASSQAKTQFLAHMSHEIRTPLNSVLGMAHLALATDLAPRQRDYIDKIHASGQHLLRLIDAVLDFSKVEAGELELESVGFRLASVIDQVGTMIAGKAAAKGLELVIDVAPEVPGLLQGDPLRLSQVLINYANNAVKFTESGRITISARLVEDGEAHCLLRFAVQDTGVGLSEAQKSRLFRVFQQADTSISRHYGGTGLGLAISKQLATLMGGEVGVDSSPGGGSTFWFSARLGKAAAAGLPAAVQAASGPPAPAVPADSAAAIRGARVLLADDHPLNQQVASALLEDAGVSVSLAASGREALAQLREQRFDCVLMDVQMPDLDGIEATRLIRADPQLAATCVIAMTAHAWQQDRERCLAAGMNDFISKPIEPEAFYATLARWLAERSPAGAGTAPPAGYAAPLADDPRIIDLAVPARTLRNDPAKIRRLAVKFLETTANDIARIEAALAGEDLSALRALGHRLKSPARAMGAMRLGELCQALEQAGSSDGLEVASGIVSELGPLLAQITHQVEQYLPTLAGETAR